MFILIHVTLLIKHIVDDLSYTYSILFCFNIKKPSYKN